MDIMVRTEGSGLSGAGLVFNLVLLIHFRFEYLDADWHHHRIHSFVHVLILIILK